VVQLDHCVRLIGRHGKIQCAESEIRKHLEFVVLASLETQRRCKSLDSGFTILAFASLPIALAQRGCPHFDRHTFPAPAMANALDPSDAWRFGHTESAAAGNSLRL
jgi:hypothetical protein